MRSAIRRGRAKTSARASRSVARSAIGPDRCTACSASLRLRPRVGRPEDAARLLGAVDALKTASAAELESAEQALREETERLLLHRLTREAFEDLHALGAAMPVSDAVKYALGVLG